MSIADQMDAKHRSPVEDDPSTVCGHWVGKTLYWNIRGENISDDDLRRWCRLNLPDPWNFTGAQVVEYQTRAFSIRREAIKAAVEETFKS